MNQPAPVPNDRASCIDQAITDLQKRKAFGFQKYGTTLQAFNGRDAALDLYQELQDALVYQKQHMDEFNELMLIADLIIENYEQGEAELLMQAIGLLKERRAQMKREV